jgi:hypothetical protein
MTLIEKYPNAKPIIFSTPMVKAILAGNKTQTRRVLKPKPPDNTKRFEVMFQRPYTRLYARDESDFVVEAYNFNREIGDILYVRETWIDVGKAHGDIWYKASLTAEQLKFIEEQNRSWKPSIFMPKVSARIFLRITNVRVERLHGITENDIKAEGFPRVCSYCQHHNGNCSDFRANNDCQLQQTFIELWDKINAKSGFGWESNPWVLVYEFEVIEK